MATPVPKRASVALATGLLVLLVLAGGLGIRAARSGGVPGQFRRGHVATAWRDWVYLATPAPGTRPSPLAPVSELESGQVQLSRGELALIAELTTWRARQASILTMPSPFSAQQLPTVPGFWAPFAQYRAQTPGRDPLVILQRGTIALTPFQTALSWSDRAGALIVVDLAPLGDLEREPERVYARLRKLLRHEYGHLAGCAHDSGCVMTPVTRAEALDALPEEFCGACEPAIQAYANQVPSSPAQVIQPSGESGD